MHTPWHIYTPITIPIFTLTGSIPHLFCRGRGGDMGFAGMEEANTRKSCITGSISTSGESRTAARRKGGTKEGRIGSSVPQESKMIQAHRQQIMTG